MITYKYKVGRYVDNQYGMLEDDLNDSGRCGWELVNVYDGYLIYKMIINDDTE